MKYLIHCLPRTVALATLSAAPNSTREQPRADVAQDAARWTISERPLVNIDENGADTLILRTGSAVRLSNGTIVAANSRASQLQWFDASGAFLRSVDRRGQGPNEFGRSIFIYVGAADIAVAHDAMNRRYHYLTPEGRFARLDTLGDARRNRGCTTRTIIQRLPGGVDFARARATLASIPFNPRDSLRFARIDALGNVWMHDSAQAPAMTIYSPDGHRIGSTVVPTRFRPFQIDEFATKPGHGTGSVIRRPQRICVVRGRTSTHRESPPRARRHLLARDARQEFLRRHRNTSGDTRDLRAAAGRRPAGVGDLRMTAGMHG